MKALGILGMIGAGVLAGMLTAGKQELRFPADLLFASELPAAAASVWAAEPAQKPEWKRGAGVGAWLVSGSKGEAEKTGQEEREGKPAKQEDPEKKQPDTEPEETEQSGDSFENLVMADVQNVLNVRTEPDSEAGLEGYLYADCGGTILERRNGWTKLESGKLTGWAKDDYLLFGEEAAEAARNAGREVATTTTGALRIRKEPSENAGVYDLLEEGAKYEVINDDQIAFVGGDAIPDGWVAVDYGGKTGYVSADYVDVSFEVDFGETVGQVNAREEAQKEQEEAQKERKEAKKGAEQKKTSGKEPENSGSQRSEESDAEAQKAAVASADDSVLLAALIQCEAGDEPYEGQVAVGAVVMNRVKSAAYPNTVKDVIYASGQFTPAGSGQVARVISSGKVKQSCIMAAQEAMAGSSPVGAATHFRRAGSREGTVIGSHVFW